MPFKKPHHTSDKSCMKKDDDKFEILPRGLNIVWGNDSRYWRIPEEGPAELIQVSWLEVSGVVQITKAGTYSVSFEVKVKEDGFGWAGTDVLVMAKIGKTGKYRFQANRLSPGENIIPFKRLEIPVVGPSDLHFGLYEVWSGKWKGGLQIIKAVIQPLN
ncbi:protein PHLOEM PROTEIN 2-LIKE A9 [Vigna radiata var. radiata]|uniref:Protein PHLOEM PROTEIN 2-LIKE A9 n=1 Tax=Vigna radiata var. radiata TaxID=3916 RepID=A0A1S3THI4_VIGRR|nr:protein PHLOEM PROTEIN 2-LIKE A9 [Vigna radiata var. radiata]